ncbi:hypothetical protein ACFQ3B_15610 [Stackebrandtia endophytica]|uniref:hypothetical protein n=1 Tax=Stackebrandtia endophytica TaxID=1496996 RepID=UPI001153BADE|nr:hypothetical protein [Stackebrandtia endophytica]
MRDTFELLVDEDSLEMNSIGTIWGAVWCEVGGIPFPERTWNDMAPAVVVALFTAARTAARPGFFSPIDVYFFDGPFRLRLRPTQSDDLMIDFLHRDREFMTSAAVDRRNLVDAVQKAAGRLVLECEQRGWSDNDDVYELRRQWNAPMM